MKRIMVAFIAMCMLLGSMVSATAMESRIEARICPKCGLHMTLHAGPWEHWGSTTKTCSIHGSYTSYVSARRYTCKCSGCGYSYEDDRVDWSESGCPDCK